MLTDFAALGAELARVSNQPPGRAGDGGGHRGAGDRRPQQPRADRRPGGDRARARARRSAARSSASPRRIARAMTYAPLDGAAVGDAATLLGPAGVHPAESWVGRIVDAFGQPLDGRPLAPGAASATLRRAPPPPATRKGLGARLATGLCVFDTILPIARGQRIGVFAGSGIGKSIAARRPRPRHRGRHRGLCADRRARPRAARLRRQRARARRAWSAPWWSPPPPTRRR